MEKQTAQGITRKDIFDYVFERYNTVPERTLRRLPNYAVLRRSDNKNRYAAILDVAKNKLGLVGEERIDILEINCNPVLREMLMGQEGFLPAYHINRENWITVLLDGSVERKTVLGLLDESYEMAKGKSKKSVRNEPTSWLVPVNPKYYDIEKAFAESDTILWKQSNSVIVGDTVYLYLATPFSCVRYKCVAVEVDIPYEYDDGKVRMHKVMKIKRLHTYDNDAFGLNVLKEHGIVSVRGPRGIPYGLLYKLEKESGNGTKI